MPLLPSEPSGAAAPTRVAPAPTPAANRPASALRVPRIHPALHRTNWPAIELGWPLLAFLIANLVLIGLSGDRWLADQIYAFGGGSWALKDSYITSHIVHKLGKRLSILAWLVLAGTLLASVWMPRLRAIRRPLATLAASVVLSTLVVSTLKHLTHMDCPWDMDVYGGTKPYLDLFDLRPANLRASGCFPAGHASAGYAWVALYFFALSVAPRLRWVGLACGLCVGLVFGISQQLRGAHFMSHDVWTLTICWLCAVMLFRLQPHNRGSATATAATATAADGVPAPSDTSQTEANHAAH